MLRHLDLDVSRTNTHGPSHQRRMRQGARRRCGADPVCYGGPMFQTDLLRGKRILVTGGGTGLGFSMGRRFLELGAELVICGRREHVLTEAAARLTAETGG